MASVKIMVCFDKNNNAILQYHSFIMINCNITCIIGNDLTLVMH